MIAALRLRAHRRRVTANRSPWTGHDDLTRMAAEVRAVRRRAARKRERTRQLLRKLPW